MLINESYEGILLVTHVSDLKVFSNYSTLSEAL